MFVNRPELARILRLLWGFLCFSSLKGMKWQSGQSGRSIKCGGRRDICVNKAKYPSFFLVSGGVQDISKNGEQVINTYVS